MAQGVCYAVDLTTGRGGGVRPVSFRPVLNVLGHIGVVPRLWKINNRSHLCQVEWGGGEEVPLYRNNPF